jgi:hypothetical protein
MSELSPDSLAILEAGRDGDEPSEADRARLRSSILRVVGAGALGLAGVAGAKARGAAGSPEAKAESGAGSLEAETKRLREAHAALQAGDPEAALSMLEKGSDEGELREERTAARFLTLCKLGRTAEAAELAASFIRESPQSPLVDRVRAGCPTSRAPGKPAGGAAAPAPIHDSPPPDPAPAPPFDIND